LAIVAVPSAVLTSTVKPPSTALSKLTVTVMAPLSSFPLTSAMVSIALSLSSMVTVAVSAISISDELTVTAFTFDSNTLINSSASTSVSSVTVRIIVCVSEAVPVKFAISPDKAV